jgi:hypothetical protein
LKSTSQKRAGGVAQGVVLEFKSSTKKKKGKTKIPLVLEKLKEEDCKFKVSLGYLVRSCL